MIVLYIVGIAAAVLILAYSFMFHRELYHTDAVLEGNTHVVVDKLMVVAHPDDELIFGGRELLEEQGWLVVCVTGGSNRSGNLLSFYPAVRRIREFKAVMDALQCRYEMWDYEDYCFNANWGMVNLQIQLAELLQRHTYKKIITHNPDGEYGHIQHKRISDLIHNLRPSNLFVFNYVSALNTGFDPLPPFNPYVPQLSSLLALYSSQHSIITKHHLNIIHQGVRPVTFTDGLAITRAVTTATPDTTAPSTTDACDASVDLVQTPI
ncbi:GlcNAc-PI de-N-acetylase [uncultured virus]|nr:GlcNAc-PI de-N-acetylase [uncultured virus]